jgi:hypothetical protein
LLNSALGFVSVLLSIPKAHEDITSMLYLAIASLTSKVDPVDIIRFIIKY